MVRRAVRRGGSAGGWTFSGEAPPSSWLRHSRSPICPKVSVPLSMNSCVPGGFSMVHTRRSKEEEEEEERRRGRREEGEGRK
jgi:hypothetical protein